MKTVLFAAGGFNFIIVDNDNDAFIRSTMRDLDSSSLWYIVCDTIEALVIAHYNAGIDVNVNPYLEGLDTMLKTATKECIG